jgi:hypothetical protein
VTNGVDKVSISPAFDPDIVSYSVMVGGATASVDVKATVADARATLRINNQVTPSGQAQTIELSPGSNTITIGVSGPGADKVYTLVATRGTNANLANLVLVPGGLAEVFDPQVLSYTALVGNQTTSVQVTATAADDRATIGINGQQVQSGQPATISGLIVGQNIVTIVVTALDNSTNSYTVAVTRSASSIADLSLLEVTAGGQQLLSNFTPATVFYTTAAVPFSTSSVDVRAVLADTSGSLTINNQVVQSGQTITVGLPIFGGNNTITVVVTAQSSATKTYTVTVPRAAPSTNANLSNLTVNPPGGTVTNFSPGNLGPYTVTVGSDQTSVTVAGFLEDQRASLTINNVPANSGQGVPVPLLSPAPSSTPISVTVVSESGAVQTYGLIINRAAPTSSNANLQSLAVSPGQLQPSFSAGTTNYNVSVGNNVTGIIFTAVPQDGGATMTITLNNGSPAQLASGQNFTVQPLQVGNNTVRIRVTAPAGNTRDYVTTVSRAAPPSSDATLSNLVVNPPGGTVPGFNPQSSGPYTVNEPFGVSNVTVSVTRSNSNATVFIDGSQTTSLPIQLMPGPSSRRVNILVIAQDTVTTKSYAVDINVQAPSSNANLSSLSVTPGGSCSNLSTTTSCTVSVSSTTTQVTISATKADAAANMTGAVTAPPGTASGQSSPLPLNGPGTSTNFTITVTAQNGTTTKVYTVTVNRAQSTNANLSNLQVFAGSTTTPPNLLIGFSPTTLTYTISPPVANTLANVTVVATKSDSTSTLSGAITSPSGQPSGQATVQLGAPGSTTAISIMVTAQNGTTTNTYTVNVPKAP